MIPLNDFSRQWESVGPYVLACVQRMGTSGWYILGREVEQFEAELARFWGRRYAIGVGNGMDAISIALRCLNVGEGTKVLTTPLTAFATTLAVMHVGGVPVFVDVDRRGQLDLEQCRSLLKRDRSIRAMIPVHLYGLAGDGAALRRLMDEFELAVVEDCAQSIGAAFTDGSKTGTVGQFAATSFYPTKNLGTLGDGGAILCDDEAMARRARTIRHYGQSSQYVHADYGLNSRLDELQAAILRGAMLPRLGQWTAARQSVAIRYLEGIRNPRILTIDAGTGTSVWHLFPIFTPHEQREAFRTWMTQHGIVTGVHYPRLTTEQDALTTYGRFEVVGKLENAERFAMSEVSLPIHPFLNDDEVTTIIRACNEWTP